jgi:MFS family permease
LLRHDFWLGKLSQDILRRGLLQERTFIHLGAFYSIYLSAQQTIILSGNLSKVLNSDGNSETEQKAKLNSIFAIGSSLTSFGTIVFGAFFDRFGTFWTRIVAIFLAFVGNACLFLATPNESDM